MRRIALAVAVGATLLLAAGCKPTYPKCSSDEHCKEQNEVCVNGQCRECGSDENCPQGFVCQTNKCVPQGTCVEDKNCPSGQKCKAGRCAVHECDQDSDCQAGKCRGNRCVVGACNTNDDCPAGEDCQAGTCVSKSSDVCDYQPIRFGFNESSLDSDSQAKLAQLAVCLKKQNAKVTIEGHADERGTEEYNLQLSNRRAAAVKKYLVDLGVSGAKIDTVGYGENRPAVNGSNEGAWASNRRVEFKL
jgi:peptidoglycan-associated lipoprotein